MNKKLILFLVYAASGSAFLYLFLLLTFKLSLLDKIISVNRLFILFAIPFIVYLLLIFPFEERLKTKSSILIIIVILLLLAAGILLLKAKERLKSINLQYYVFTCSMYHYEKNFDAWWEKNKHKYANITKEEFKKFPFHNGIISGTYSIPISPEDVEVGDVITYLSTILNQNISHRVIKKWHEDGDYFFEVIGDNSYTTETVYGYYVYEKSIENKLISFISRDGCKRIGE